MGSDDASRRAGRVLRTCGRVRERARSPDSEPMRRACITTLLLAAASALPRDGAAQAPAHLRALTIPPRTVGTCLPSLNGRADMRRLVMKTRSPGGSREILFGVDARGRITSIVDRTQVMTAVGQSTGDLVLAVFDATGALVRGQRTRTEITAPAAVVASRDPAALRAWSKDATPQQATVPLDAAGERQVRALAEWVRDRCPAAR